MITEEQRVARKNFIGSSDISALFNDGDGCSLNPYATVLDVWCEKYFEVTPLDETDAMARGNRYEAALIEYAADYLGWAIEDDPEIMNFVCEDHPVFACNLDGFTTHGGDTDPYIVEAKTTSMASEYGEPGTDDVPFSVLLQVSHQMLCTGFRRAYVVVLLGGFRLHEEIYVVERNETIIAAIIEAGEKFWNDHVLTGMPPEQNEPGNIEIFKRIVRVPETLADVPDKLIAAWEIGKADALLAKKATEKIFSELLQAIGDAEGSELDDGRTFTYLMQNVADKIDRKKLKADYPSVYDAVATPSRHRVARIKKAT